MAIKLFYLSQRQIKLERSSPASFFSLV